MPRKKVWPPSVYSHPSGQDRIRIFLPSGRCQDIWLGRSGTPEARQNYLRVVAELEAGSGAPLPSVGAGMGVSELIRSYKLEAKGYHTAKQYARIRLAIGPLLDLYGTATVSEFGPVALEAVQTSMVKLGWSRRYINRAISFIRQCFKWGARKELIPFQAYDRLRTVPGLRKGKTAAHDPEPRMNVPDDIVEKTLPFLPEPVKGLVQFQRWTGCRPEEATLLQPDEIDMLAFIVDGVPVWVYSPAEHKTAWRGLNRRIPIGPRCQEMLKPFLDRAFLLKAAGHKDFCFSPKAAARNLARAGNYYRVDSYDHAVARGCKRAGVAHWTPYQLRHAVATMIELDNERAWEQASLVLGHNDPSVIRVYAHGALQRAAKIVAKFG